MRIRSIAIIRRLKKMHLIKRKPKVHRSEKKIALRYTLPFKF